MIRALRIRYRVPGVRYLGLCGALYGRFTGLPRFWDTCGSFSSSSFGCISMSICSLMSPCLLLFSLLFFTPPFLSFSLCLFTLALAPIPYFTFFCAGSGIHPPFQSCAFCLTRWFSLFSLIDSNQNFIYLNLLDSFLLTSGSLTTVVNLVMLNFCSNNICSRCYDPESQEPTSRYTACYGPLTSVPVTASSSHGNSSPPAGYSPPAMHNAHAFSHLPASGRVIQHGHNLPRVSVYYLHPV